MQSRVNQHTIIAKEVRLAAAANIGAEIGYLARASQFVGKVGAFNRRKNAWLFVVLPGREGVAGAWAELWPKLSFDSDLNYVGICERGCLSLSLKHITLSSAGTPMMEEIIYDQTLCLLCVIPYSALEMETQVNIITF